MSSKSKTEIDKNFQSMEVVLVGTPRQFLIHNGEYFCVKASCDSECPYFNKGCTFEEELLDNNLVPNSRRGFGVEERPFLVLRFKEGLTIQDIPKELWTNEHDDLNMNPYNLHFVTTDVKETFRILKGQIRYYATPEEFNQTEYAKYLDIFSEYEPVHHMFALDYSAVEPKVSTMVCREPEWLKIFKGLPKNIVNEVDVEGLEGV